jgi:rare lipoprotein A
LLVLFIFLSLITFEPDSTVENGKASFYHDKFDGRETSNGEIFDTDDFTAAHRTLPFNTLLLVRNKSNNKSVIVRINDRGPFKKSRIIDLTRSAAMKLEMVPNGVVPVKIEVLGYLNEMIINDSVFSIGEIRDCYGNEMEYSNETIHIWKTDNLKHAVYMASSLCIDFDVNIGIKASEEKGTRTYSLMLTEIENKTEAEKIIKKFRKAGFINSTLLR